MKLTDNNFIGDISVDDFLQNYWHQKPLIIRQVFPQFESVISPDELAGLACEDDVESRILVEQGLDKQTPWQVFHGPQEEDIFSQLPETHWTLLVQEANRHIPELQELADYFSFIPNWRFDDIMISYAPEFGSVGPHSDQYDVFLLQAQGQRHWQIADYKTTDEDLVTDIESRILKEFFPEQDWILNPGDILYLPPGILHHGVAKNECMTYSIGFRAPTSAELINGILPYAIEDGLLNKRYKDPKIKQQSSCGEINNHTLNHLVEQIQDLLVEPNKLKGYLAQFLTETTHPLSEENLLSIDLHTDTVKKIIQNKKTLYRNEDYRYVYTKNTKDQFSLYINGERVRVTESLQNFIPILTDHRIIEYSLIEEFLEQPEFINLIHNLIQQEYLLIDEFDAY